MRNKLLHLFASNLLLLGGLLVGGGPVIAGEGAPLDGAVSTPSAEQEIRGGDFTLESSAGPVALSDFRGRAVLLYFGYTKCPDICPTSLTNIAQALRQLDSADLARVQGIFVSIDPERDTPQMLKEYVAHFHPNLIGLSGTAEQVAEVAARYGVKYQRQELKGSAFGYTVDHSSLLYFIGTEGAIHSILPDWTPPGMVAEALSYLLQER